MTTTWTKNAKESFIPNNTTPQTTIPVLTPVGHQSGNTTIPRNRNTDDVAHFGNDVYIGKDADELIIMSNNVEDASTPTPTPSQEPSLLEKLNVLNTNFTFENANDSWQSLVSSSTHTLGKSDENAAKVILSSIYEDFETPEAKNDLKSLSTQISRWFAIVIASYIVALNWWYLWCYTTFKFDFRSLIFLKPNPVLAPAINAFEVLNYYLINMRMDSDPILPVGLGTEDIRKLWHWRPVTFSILHFVLILVFLSSSLFAGFSSILAFSKDSAIYYLAIALTIYYYLLLYKTWYKIPLSLGGGLTGLFSLIAVTVLTILSVGIVVPMGLLFFTMYLAFLSNTTLFVFNWFWPPSIYSAVKQIFQELKEAPVYDDNPSDPWGKVGNYLFQNFHNIYIVVIVLFPLLIWNITESAKFSNETLIGFGILVNILLFFLFSWSGVKDVLNLIAKIFETSKSAEDPNEPGFGLQSGNRFPP